MISRLLLVVLLAHPAWADYPVIQSLSHSDTLFGQVQKDIERFYAAYHQERREDYPKLALYRYRLRQGDTINTVAARFNLSKDTLATLNRVDNADDFLQLHTVYIPNIPGVFVPLEPESDFEEIIYTARVARSEPAWNVELKLHGYLTRGLYYAGDSFTNVEHSYFLRTLFRIPLHTFTYNTSSRFGPRTNPFTGLPELHKGLDLAAPAGTEVMAAREGVVSEIGYHGRYGNYVILEHANDYTSLYAHLSTVAVTLNQKVKGGTLIGGVGSTGATTGSHLHFEIRYKGVHQNPTHYFPPGWLK